MFNIQSEILSAEKKIQGFVRQTPMDLSRSLSKLTGMHVYLKSENLQYTGSFKVRGAINALLSLSEEQKLQGVVAASTGNHGAAIAYGLSQFAIPGVIFVPENASPTKIANIRNYDVDIQYYGQDCVETELYAKEYAIKHHKLYISPYNHIKVIAGQGTIGIEILKQLDHIDLVFVAVGGGGLISGVGGYIKSISPKTKIIGCLPANSPVMAESVKAGKIIDMDTLPTLSDATAGGIEPDSMTLEMCKTYVDQFITVTEEEIQAAMLTLMNTEHVLIEGASGVAMAALMQCAAQYPDKTAVVILSGANISLESLKKVLT